MRIGAGHGAPGLAGSIAAADARWRRGPNGQGREIGAVQGGEKQPRFDRAKTIPATLDQGVGIAANNGQIRKITLRRSGQSAAQREEQEKTGNKPAHTLCGHLETPDFPEAHSLAKKSTNNSLAGRYLV